MWIEDSNSGIPEWIDQNNDGSLDIKDIQALLDSWDWKTLNKVADFLNNSDNMFLIRHNLMDWLEEAILDVIKVDTQNSEWLTESDCSLIQLYASLKQGFEGYDENVSINWWSWPETDKIITRINEQRKSIESEVWQRVADREEDAKREVIRQEQKQKYEQEKADWQAKIDAQKQAESELQAKEQADKDAYLAAISEAASPEYLEFVTNTINQAVDDIPDVEWFDYYVKEDYKKNLLNAVKQSVIDRWLDPNNMLNLAKDISKKLTKAYDTWTESHSNFEEWGFMDDQMVTHREVNRIISDLKYGDKQNKANVKLSYSDLADITWKMWISKYT